MSSKPKGTLWSAEPHTIAKITILESYLTAWFQILGSTRRGQDLVYIDGFAGPGKYINYSKGSPIAALIAANVSLSSLQNKLNAVKLYCFFIEEDRNRYDFLKKEIEGFSSNKNIVICSYQDTFVKALKNIQKDFSFAFSNNTPLFVFIDPFGPTGVPFSVIRDILSASTSEVLINLDADGIARILKAKEKADHEKNLNEIFGDDSWRGLLNESLSFDRLSRKMLDLYKEKLRNIKDIKYVFAFEMRTKKSSLNYFFVFASRHPLGLEKMKEAMKKVDQSGEYCFSDASVKQDNLFRFDDIEKYATMLLSVFKSRDVSYPIINDYALVETPFINCKSMLNFLDKNDYLSVKSSDPKRRKGTFNENKILSIKFL